jgi:hypothetical protein
MNKSKIFSACFIFFFSLVPLSIAASKEPVIEVTVVKGDCLIKICEKYMERPNQWKKISRLNRLKNPDLIRPGQTIIFPAGLLKGTPLEGTVSFVRGNAEYQTRESEEWRPLAMHSRVPEGSRIRTGEKSEAELIFEDGDSLFQRSDTTSELSTARKAGVLFIHKVFLKTGKVITKIKEATGIETRFEIKTPSAICAARGTAFRSSVDKEDSTRYEVLHGKIDVEAMEHTIPVKEGEGTLVIKNAPPTEPKPLLYPPSLKEIMPIYKKLPVRLAFNKVEGAVSHRIVLARDNECKDTVLEKILKPDESFIIDEITDGRYFLQSQSIDNIGLEGLSSEPSVVNIRVNPPSPFIQSPADGAVYREKSIKCQWLNVKNAAEYHIQVSEDRGFGKIVLENNTIKTMEFETKPLDYKTYYFRVCSKAEDGYEGEWSDPISFTVVPPPPAPPIDKPDIGKKEIGIRWKDLGEGITYHFQMSRDQEFRDTLIDGKTEKPEMKFQKPKEAGIYYVRTSSIDAVGYEGSFSAPQSFEIKRGLFYEFWGIAGTLGLIFFLIH